MRCSGLPHQNDEIRSPCCLLQVGLVYDPYLTEGRGAFQGFHLRPRGAHIDLGVDGSCVPAFPKESSWVAIRQVWYFLFGWLLSLADRRSHLSFLWQGWTPQLDLGAQFEAFALSVRFCCSHGRFPTSVLWRLDES